MSTPSASPTQDLLSSYINAAWKHLYQNNNHLALQSAQQASVIAPGSDDVLHLLGIIASRDQRSDLALPLLQKALDSKITELRLRHMAEALLTASHPQAALAPALDAINKFGENSANLGLLSAIYMALNQFNEAKVAAQRAIQLQPEQMLWETNLGFCELILGNIEAGFKALTGRSENLPALSRAPALRFCTPCDIWLRKEQGVASVLYYLRYAPYLIKQGFRLHVECDKKIKALFMQTQLFASVKESLKIPHDGFWLNVGDLPLAAMQRGCEEIMPPLPLQADSSRMEKILAKLTALGPAPYIGVTWRGGPKGKKLRSGLKVFSKMVEPRALGESLKNTKGTIISLQRLPEDEESRAFKEGLGRDFVSLATYNDNLQDMLALLSILDIYIAVPNSNVHLRESLNKPSLVLLNQPWQDWRWQIEGNSPWYPNSHVFRQEANADWKPALKKLQLYLEQLDYEQEIVSQEQDNPLTIDVDQNSHDIKSGWRALNSGNIKEAVNCAQQSLALNPNDPDALHLLGWAAQRDNKPTIAVSILAKASELAPFSGAIMSDYARALIASNEIKSAIEVLNTSLNQTSLEQKDAVYYALGAAYQQYGAIEECIRAFKKAVKINPNHLSAMNYLGMALLKHGDIMHGFKYCSARKEVRILSRVSGLVVPWLKADCAGLNVLIKGDMGLGDELTYLRYLPWLTEAGVSVTYYAGAKLAPMLQRMGYAETILSNESSLPAANKFDLSFWVNELPVAVESLNAPEIAPPLTLKAKPELMEKWRTWLSQCGPAPYFGITWKAGVSSAEASQRKLSKSISAELFSDSLKNINGTFISLQRNIMLDELSDIEHSLGATIHDFSGLTDDLEDLLALLSLLDENIGVSNTNMHLRAGLGKGSKVLVQSPGGDWRWGFEGNKSPWFTSSTVYRQSLEGDWQDALLSLQNDLIGQYGIKTKDIKNHIPATVKSKISSRRIIWLTAGHIYEQDNLKTSDLASTRYRVLHPAHALLSLGWKSEFINEQISQAMGGWGSTTPQSGDCVIVSKVFTDFALQLTKDAKARGATVIVDFCDNFLSHVTRGPLQHALLELADKVVTSTEALAQALRQTHKRVNAVISDPVEFNKGAIKFSPGKILKLLWFGHSVNLDTLAQFLPSLANYAETRPLTLNVVTTLPNGIKDLAKNVPPNLSVTYTPWSPQATEQAISVSDIVIIPTINSDIKKAKSPNRLIEPLWAGRMVVAGELPAYIPFANSAWIGKDLIEGVKWAIENPKQVTERIAIGQKIIEENFSIQEIANQWDTLLSSEQADSTTPLKTMTKTELAILTTQKPNLPSIAIRLVQPFNLMDDYDAAIASTIDKNGVFKIDYRALLMQDLIIVQRDFPSYDTMPLLKKLKALNKKLVYETDDAFHLIPENHPKAFHRQKSNAINDFANLADVITVSTQALAKEFSSIGKVKVIPNLLSHGLWTNEIYQLKENSRKSHPDNAIRIGLIGGTNHQNDFAVLRKVLTVILNKYKHVQWVAYGDGASNFLNSTLNTTKVEVIASNFDYNTHPTRLAKMGLDIALVPLLDDPFNQCKSNLKFLEYGFLGVPAIYSNVESYNGTVINGKTGLLANNTTQDWVSAIEKLIDNPELRKQMGANAHHEVQNNWMLTPENNGWRDILEEFA